jgi:hypothetical protein
MGICGDDLRGLLSGLEEAGDERYADAGASDNRFPAQDTWGLDDVGMFCVAFGPHEPILPPTGSAISNCLIGLPLDKNMTVAILNS